ncbi:unnamed protein product, partial [marine sediment metagenome]
MAEKIDITNILKGSILDKPHDALLHEALKNETIAKEVMLKTIDKDLLPFLDFDNMRLHPTQLRSTKMSKLEADIFYLIPFKDTLAQVQFHCENQATPTYNMPLRVWQYQLAALIDYEAKHRGQPLPIPISIIVYSGDDSYTHSTCLTDLFGQYGDMVKQKLCSPIPLLDVCKMSDDDIKKDQLFGLIEFT